MSNAPEGGTNRVLLVVLTALAYVIALILFFHIAVYLTDLAIAPETGSPCNSIWGRATCIGKPGVVAATFLPAVSVALIVWYLGRGGWTRWAIAVLTTLLVTTITVVVIARPRCGGGLTLGISVSSGSDGTSYEWDCLGGIK